MDFLEMRMKNKQDILSRKTPVKYFMNGDSFNVPIHEEVKKLAPVEGVIKPKKVKFVISNDKEEIINDIIEKKLTINQTRLALKKYSDIAQKENNNI